MILQIQNRIGIGLSDAGPYPRAFIFDDATENLCRVLLTLIMADDTDLYLLLVAKVLMVVHLTSDKGIGTCLHSLVEQEVPCPSADGHLR